MKTPIQKLIDICNQHKQTSFMEGVDIIEYRSFMAKINSLLVKEKQFAKECFDAGLKHGIDTCHSIEWAEYPTTPDFEQFYSKYVEQHTK